ncbi:MAG: hypothetical protein Q9160_001035 [Pyrenula sp. 1 TL-2023]
MVLPPSGWLPPWDRSPLSENSHCNYLLSDTQTTRDKWKTLTRVIKDTALDPDAGKARPDQLNLPDDPGFNLETAFNLDLDLQAFDVSTNATQQSSFLSLPSHTPSQSSHAEPQLIIPSSVSPVGGGFGLGFPEDISSAARIGNILGGSDVFEEESGLLPDPGFYFDENGEEVQGPAPRVSSVQMSARPESRAASDSMGDHFAHDDGLLALGDDELPPAEPFEVQGGKAATADQPQMMQPEQRSSSVAEAPQRRRRFKTTISDVRPELLNRDLAQWNEGYLANMANAARLKQQHKLAAQAKKNAAFWVLGQGIGEVGIGLGSERIPAPLDIFSGDRLLSALMGEEVGRKHARSTSGGSESDESGRRVRARGEGELGRGEMIMSDEGIGPEFAEDIEIGREAQPALPDDHSSQMPWNISSRAGSSQAFRSARSGFTSSIGGPLGGMELGPSLRQRSGSRHPSASPLFGRGRQRMSSMEIPDQPILAMSDSAEGLDLPAFESDDFQLYGPAAAVSTQQAAESQWVRAALDSEANNFFGFLTERLDSDQERGEVTFEELLPSSENRPIVAAQGLLHVLSLATKGLITVDQPEPFGDITIGMAGGVTTAA